MTLSLADSSKKFAIGVNYPGVSLRYLFSDKIAAEVKDFDPGRYMGFKEKRRMALFSQFAVAAARGALEDSCLLSKNAPTGTPVSSVDSERIGAILGTCIGDSWKLETPHRHS